MNSYKTEQDRKARKASLRVIEGGAGKVKVRVRELSPSAVHRRIAKKAVWIAASDTFDHDARMMLRKYRTLIFNLGKYTFGVPEDVSKTEKLRSKQRDK